MQCQDARLILTDLIYGEEIGSIPVDFKDHFSKCPQCSAEYLELLETKQYLAFWKDEEAPSRLVFLKSATKPARSFLRPFFPWLQPSLAYAAILLLLAAGIVLARVQLVWGDGKIALQSGWFVSPVSESGGDTISSPATSQEIMVSLEKLLTRVEARQNEQTLSLLQRAMDSMEYQRQMDLTRLREELGSLQQTYYQTIERNSTLLEQNARYMRQSKY